MLQSHSARSLNVPSEIAKSRVAVVLAVKSIDKCREMRARSLAVLVGSGFDVWILHSPEAQDQEVLDNLTAMNIRSEAQEQNFTESWKQFGSKRIGYAMAAFLRFVVKHSEYDFAWHLEDDVYYTGNWTKLLAQLQADFPTESLLARTYYETKSVRKSNKLMKEGRLCKGECGLTGGASCFLKKKTGLKLFGAPHLWNEKKGLRKLDQMIVKVWWMMARVSHEYAVKLAMHLDDGASGNHECIAAPFCMSQSRFRKGSSGWCTTAQLPDSVLKTWSPGGLRNNSIQDRLAQRMQAGQLEPDKLYHPMKCEKVENGTHFA